MEKLESGGASNTFKEMEIAFAGRFDFPRKEIHFWRPDPRYMILIGGIVKVKFSKFYLSIFSWDRYIPMWNATWDKDTLENRLAPPPPPSFRLSAVQYMAMSDILN